MTSLPDWESFDFDATPVLLNRPLRPGARGIASLFGDDRWYLDDAVFEDHANGCSIGFMNCASNFRAAAKRYVWLLLNAANVEIGDADNGAVGPFAVVTVSKHARHLFVFLNYLDSRGVAALSEVDEADYEGFLEFLMEAVPSLSKREDEIAVVRSLWRCRRYMTYRDALPDSPPWAGDLTRDLVGARPPSPENLRHRIPEDVMQPLLLWAIRWVEQFSEDILSAWREYNRLVSRLGAHSNGRRPNDVESVARDYVADLARRGSSLPGQRRSNLPGAPLAIRWGYIRRVLDVEPASLRPGTPGRLVIERSGLPVEPCARLDAEIIGTLDGLPWRSERIAYDEVHQLVRLLSAASFIVTTYLSGMRPGEALGIRRGCVTHDEVTGLWLLRALEWKGVVDRNGCKVPEGQIREDPWVVVPVVERAVAVLETLADGDILFPPARPNSPGGGASRRRRGDPVMTTHRMTVAVRDFVAGVNDYCAAASRADSIPLSVSTIQPSQFRRTLAWHLYRRPNGLVAGAIQYGHLHAQMFVGYAGNYHSGFASVAVVEDLLARLERVAEAQASLDEGGRVSGPAASIYRNRVEQATADFGGKMISTTKQAEKLVKNPNLQVFSGDGMTCVFDPTTAMCGTQMSPVSRTLLPVLSDCKRNCRNIAHTDRDMEVIRARAFELERVLRDSLSPSIRHEREKAELERLHEIIANHDSTGTT